MTYQVLAMLLLLIPLGEWVFRDASDRLNLALAETFGPFVGFEPERERVLRALGWMRWLNTAYFTALSVVLLALTA